MQTSLNMQTIRLWPWRKIFIIAVVGVLILSAILRVLTPPSKQLPITESLVTNDEGVQTQFRNIEYVGSQPSFPRQLPALTPNQEPPDFLQNIIERYQLSESAEFSWSSTTYQLSREGAEAEQTYTLINSSSIPTIPITSLEALQTQADQLIKELFPAMPLSTLSSPSITFSTGEHLEASELGVGNLLAISYTLTQEGVPVYFDKSTRPQVDLIFRSTGEVQKLSFTTKLKSYAKGENYSLISINRAIQNLNTLSLGTVVSSSRESFGQIDLSELRSGKLETVLLEYRYDSINNTLIPHYLFSGTAVDNKGVTISLDILTPAVPTTTKQ